MKRILQRTAAGFLVRAGITFGVFLMLLVISWAIDAARADTWTVRGGTGITSEGPTGATKVFGVRTESHAFRGIYSANEFGGWVDNRPGTCSAGYTKAQLGVVPGPDVGVYGKAFFGPALITARDSILGGFFQFATDVGFGVRDADTTMGITYSHFSSAGISKPNKGRDYVSIELGISW